MRERRTATSLRPEHLPTPPRRRDEQAAVLSYMRLQHGQVIDVADPGRLFHLRSPEGFQADHLGAERISRRMLVTVTTGEIFLETKAQARLICLAWACHRLRGARAVPDTSGRLGVCRHRTAC